MKGVGQQTVLSRLSGTTGIYVCAQVKGYRRAAAAWMHLERELKGK